MEVIFVNVTYDGDFSEIVREVIKRCKKKEIRVFYVCNWEKLAKEICKALKKKGVKVRERVFVGCEHFEVKDDIVICDGKFHLKCFTGRFIHVDPLQNEVKIINQKEVKKIFPFNAFNNFGILVSIKPGQFNLKLAKKIKKILERMGKKAYIFLGDEIKDLENFPFIEVWINTACPRLKDEFEDMLFFNAIDFIHFYDNWKSSKENRSKQKRA